MRHTWTCLAVTLASLTAAPSVLGAPFPTDLRPNGDMATRLNEATVARGIDTTSALLDDADPSRTRTDDFFGKRTVIVEPDPRPNYRTVGVVSDALPDRQTVPAGGDAASVRVGLSDVPPLAGFFDARASRRGAPDSGTGGRLAEITQRPPGEVDIGGIRRTTRGNAGRSPASTGAAVSSDVAAAKPVLPEQRPGTTAPAAAAPPVRSRTVFLRQAGADPLSEQVMNAFVARVLTQQANFPGGTLAPTRPLLDVYPLSAAAAQALTPQGTATADAAVVSMPLTLFPSAEQGLPSTVRIYRDPPRGMTLEGRLDTLLMALWSMSGPEIISVLMTGSALVGLFTIWRGRRRLE